MQRFILCLVLVACSEPAPEPVAPQKPASAPASAPVKAVSNTVDSGPRVLAVTGDVTIDGKPAVVGTPVTATSTVETAAGASARITLVPHSVIAIREKTKFTLAPSPRKQWSVQLALGALWSFLPKGKASYEVITNNAVAGVRGTTLFTANLGEGSSAVCTCDGEVELTAGNKRKVVKSKHIHTGTHIRGTDKEVKLEPQKPTKTPPGHDDVEGAELEQVRDNTDR